MKNIILSFSGFMKKVPNTIENTGLSKSGKTRRAA